MISEKSSAYPTAIRGLRFRAVAQRADESQQQHARDVHRHALNAGGQTESKERSDDREIGTKRHRAFEVHDEAAREKQPQADRGHRDTRDRSAHCRAPRAECRDRTCATDEHDVQDEVEHRHRHAEAQRRPRIAGRAKRAPQHEEHQQPDAVQKHRLQKRQGLGAHGGRGVHQIEERRREHVADGRKNAERQRHRREKGLIHRAVDLLVIVGPRGPRDEHAHPGEQGTDEDDDDQEDLPAHADRGIGRVADVVPDERVVDDTLEPADGILKNRRPGDLPDRRHNRPVDNGSIEALALSAGT